MTKKVYYEKIGRKYVPVSEYDSDLIDSFKQGNHLVMSYPGGQSRRYNVKPNYAAMIAAGRTAEDSICDAIFQAAQMHRAEHENTCLTNEQHEIWQQFKQVMGERGSYIQFKSTRDIAEAGIQAMTHEATRLMDNPAVKRAYEQFMLVVELTKEQ